MEILYGSREKLEKPTEVGSKFVLSKRKKFLKFKKKCFNSFFSTLIVFSAMENTNPSDLSHFGVILTEFWG